MARKATSRPRRPHGTPPRRVNRPGKRLLTVIPIPTQSAGNSTRNCYPQSRDKRKGGSAGAAFSHSPSNRNQLISTEIRPSSTSRPFKLNHFPTKTPGGYQWITGTLPYGINNFPTKTMRASRAFQEPSPPDLPATHGSLSKSSPRGQSVNQVLVPGRIRLRRIPPQSSIPHQRSQRLPVPKRQRKTAHNRTAGKQNSGPNSTAKTRNLV